MGLGLCFFFLGFVVLVYVMGFNVLCMICILPTIQNHIDNTLFHLLNCHC